VKLWIDECLSPALVGEAQRHGFEATCNRDRGLLGAADPDLLERVVAEGFVLVTNNEADFVRLCESSDVHGGLVVLPQSRRDDQLRRLDSALAHIEERARSAGEAPADWMLNRVVEVDARSDACADYPLPAI
jgi:hypothetical protein